MELATHRLERFEHKALESIAMSDERNKKDGAYLTVGRQYARKIPQKDLPILVFDNTWVLPCPFHSFSRRAIYPQLLVIFVVTIAQAVDATAIPFSVHVGVH